MNAPVCKTCTHYHQHYTINAQCCSEVQCGHCSYPRLKHREPNARACSHYEARRDPAALPDRGSAIHFLTTEFLQYILSLELPPELRNEE